MISELRGSDASSRGNVEETRLKKAEVIILRPRQDRKEEYTFRGEAEAALLLPRGETNSALRHTLLATNENVRVLTGTFSTVLPWSTTYTGPTRNERYS